MSGCMPYDVCLMIDSVTLHLICREEHNFAGGFLRSDPGADGLPCACSFSNSHTSRQNIHTAGCAPLHSFVCISVDVVLSCEPIACLFVTSNA
jgi:hypothetical protein